MTSKLIGAAPIVVVCLAQLMIAADATVLYLAIPDLTRQFDASNEAVLWIADIYGFAMAGLVVTMGNLADRIGRRRMLFYGTIAFAACSVLAAYAPNSATMIAARALLGVAGAAMLPATTSLLRSVFTTQQARTAAVGASAAANAVGFVLGPLIGGLLLTVFWWGSVFLVNIPVCALILAFLRYVPESRSPSRLPLDLLSVLLSVVSIVAATYAIKGAVHSGVGRPDVLGTFLLGGVAFALFARRQLRLPVPLLDLRLFRNRGFTASVGTNLISVFTLAAFGLIISQYFQLVREWSPIQSGLGYLPSALAAMVAGGMLAAKAVIRLGRAVSVVLGLGLSVVGFTMFAFIGPDTPYLVLMVAQLAFGAGTGLTLTVAGDTILGTVPNTRAGAAAAVSATAYELGGSLGIAVIGSVLDGLYRAQLVLPAGVPAPATEQVHESFTSALMTAADLPGTTGAAVHANAVAAYVGGIQMSMAICAAMTAIVAVLAWLFLRGVPQLIEQEAAEDLEATVRIPFSALRDIAQPGERNPAQDPEATVRIPFSALRGAIHPIERHPVQDPEATDRIPFSALRGAIHPIERNPAQDPEATDRFPRP